jgi:hypothetical protein
MLGMNMENKQGGFSLVEPGGPIDFAAQIYSLPFQVLRNIQAYNDPDEYGEGTAVGHLMAKEGGLMSVFGGGDSKGLLGLFQSEPTVMPDSRNAPQPWGKEGDNSWSPDGINVFHGDGYNWNTRTPSSSTPSSSGTSYDGDWGTSVNNSAQSDYSNVSWGDMTESDASSWDDY